MQSFVQSFVVFAYVGTCVLLCVGAGRRQSM